MAADAENLPLADQSVDFVFGSPPYLDRRSYEGQAKRECVEWADWMVRVSKEAARVCRGLCVWIVAGSEKGLHYRPGPELLIATLALGTDLTVWRPSYWHRNGIPGSGGPQRLRNVVEYAVMFSAHKRLPFANPKACGHPWKYAGGGDYKHRRGPHDERDVRPRNAREGRIANPGNLFFCKVGGGHMGSKWASLNEAPFPEALASHYLKMYCPPGGLVLDPFLGSGTTLAAACKLGMNGIGSDLRPEQLVRTHCRLDGISVEDYLLGQRPLCPIDSQPAAA